MKTLLSVLLVPLVLCGCGRDQRQEEEITDLKKRIEIAQGEIIALRDNQANLHTLSNRVSSLEFELQIQTEHAVQLESQLSNTIAFYSPLFFSSEKRIATLESLRDVDNSFLRLEMRTGQPKTINSIIPEAKVETDSLGHELLIDNLYELGRVGNSLDALDEHYQASESLRRMDRVLPPIK